MPRAAKKEYAEDSDDDDIIEISPPPVSRPRRAAAQASMALSKQKAKQEAEEEQEDEVEAAFAPARTKGKGKGKAKATSDDEREHTLERASSRNKAQIDADAMLAAQLAAENNSGSEDELLSPEEDSYQSADDDDSGSESDELPLRKRARVSNGSAPKKKAAAPSSRVNGKKKTSVASPSSRKKDKKKIVLSDSDFLTEDSDGPGLDSDEDGDLTDTEEVWRVRANRAKKGGVGGVSISMPDDWVFIKPNISNYIKTPANQGKRLPLVIREIAKKAREDKKREADAAAGVKDEPNGDTSKSRSRPSSAKRVSSSSTVTNGKKGPAKGSMQEDQRFETVKQRQARIRREKKEARSAAREARTGVKRARLSQYQRNKGKLEAHHPELTTVWQDLADVPIEPPKAAEPPHNIAPGVSLLPFQLESLHWLVKQEDSLWQGGLLADEMGMGKTVQMIALMLSDEDRFADADKKGPRATLVVAPTVALMQWNNEITKYAPQFKVVVWHGANRTATATTAAMRKADVVLTSYAVLESSFRRQESGFVRKGEKFTEPSAVHKVEWRRVILDEAHNIKDRATNTAKGAFALKSVYRWCLSGTPLQNRVGELFSMVRFIGAEPFANYYCLQCDCKSLHWHMIKGKFCAACGHTPMHHTCFWNNEVLKPIQRNGAELGEGKDAFMRLRTLLQHMMLRRTKLERADDMGLPPRTMLVRRDVFNEEEADLYQSLYTDGQRKFTTFIDHGTVLNNYSNIFTLLTRMRQMACHPDLVLRSKTGANAKLLAGQLSETHVCKLCADEAEDPIMSSCRHVFCRACISEYVGDGEDAGMKLECPYCHGILAIDLEQETMDDPRPEQNARQGLLSRLDLSKWRSSTKIEALVEELTALRSEDHTIKSIVFSQFRSFLDLIAFRLQRAGFKIARLEGDMTPQQRDRTIKYFSENTSVSVFLISLKAGGVALNLTEASRVYLMDPWWNPSVEMQAADRIHRIGQHRPIIVKRMIIENSIEARIVELQNKKSAMIEAAIGKDDSAMGRLSVADLQFLFQIRFYTLITTMASGIALSPECLETYQQLKLSKRFKFVTYRINDKSTEIIVDKTSTNTDWDDFTATLPENECRWAVYDFEWQKEGDGKRNKILFVSWSPDTAPVRGKMVAASSKDALRRALVGIGAEVQATDASEIAFEAIQDKVSRGGH
ncbi:DNA repair protein rad16 [Tilletia horrida]|nr:DNA repair protein rad16 [Tilletia horrida]